MARKKVVLVIVEGPSDDVALGIGLNQVFDKDSVYIHIMYGDITTRKGVSSQNIVSKMGNEVRAYAKSQHYVAGDFKQIIHIVDMDGAYIPNENIMEGAEKGKVIYESAGIYTSNVEGLVARNKQKRDNLFRLRNCGMIWGIPYGVYYMSCNLDHVLYDKRNSSDEEKEADSYLFAIRCRDEEGYFVKYICESSFAVKGKYKESWKYIEFKLNSLKRHTNLSICLEMGKSKNN